MKSFAIAALLGLASAHTRFTTLHINGASQGDGTCIRMDTDPSTTTGFVDSITGADMACGVDGELAVNRTCPAKAGDTIALEHRAWADGSHPDVGAIVANHLGSTAIYMKKMADTGSSTPYAGTAQGDGWFKVCYDGFSDGTWGTTKMISNGGLVSTTIPSDLASGYYLVRSEVLTLQNVVDEHINPQMYMGCAQVFVEGSGSATPADTVAIPGYIDESTPALSYNIYKQTPPNDPFEEFGPAVYGSGAAVNVSTKVIATSLAATSSDVSAGTCGESKPSSTASSIPLSSSPPTTLKITTDNNTDSTTSFIGACPANTVLTVANQCLTEIESWSDDTPGPLPKCWAASQSCWDQLTTCWDNLSPSINPNDMNVGCNLWNTKCTELVAWCSAGNLQGPPDAGKVLGKKKRSVNEVNGKMAARRSVGARRITAENIETTRAA